MKAYERLIEYVKFDTKSSDESGLHPSTDAQFALAEKLKSELISLGCLDVTLTDKCYLYAKLGATPGYENGYKLGFIAHMDTAPDFRGAGVNPVIYENYNGEDIALGESGRVLSKNEFPHLESLKGRTLITTDGTTLLGADDKAGIAEIMTMIEKLSSDSIPHGEIRIAFTPDEEIGEGADFFDVIGFDADGAFTVDGGEEGSLEYENFNAYSAKFEVSGFNVHPGSAKNVMKNASLIAMEINSHLPTLETPSNTDGYEGFYHLTDMVGSVESATLSYIVRDHDASLIESKLKTLSHIEKIMNEKYGDGTVKLTLKESYRNMKEVILCNMHLVENAKLAIERAGLTPAVMPIRGGTDGARLSFMGLPCPNLGTGGYAYHGPFEHITKEGMDSSVEVLLALVNIYKDR